MIGVILVVIGASLLAAGLIIYFKTKSTRLGAIVSNGYECASIGRYTNSLNHKTIFKQFPLLLVKFLIKAAPP